MDALWILLGTRSGEPLAAYKEKGQPAVLTAIYVDSGICVIGIYAHARQLPQPRAQVIYCQFIHFLFLCHKIIQKILELAMLEGTSDQFLSPLDIAHTERKCIIPELLLELLCSPLANRMGDRGNRTNSPPQS